MQLHWVGLIRREASSSNQAAAGCSSILGGNQSTRYFELSGSKLPEQFAVFPGEILPRPGKKSILGNPRINVVKSPHILIHRPSSSRSGARTAAHAPAIADISGRTRMPESTTPRHLLSGAPAVVVVTRIVLPRGISVAVGSAAAVGSSNWPATRARRARRSESARSRSARRSHRVGGPRARSR